MRSLTPQIIWHNRDPVLCIDFDPSCCPSSTEEKDNFYRLATGGADNHLLIWHLRGAGEPKIDLVCVADLTRHSKAINTLRFSPCGKYLASADDDAYVYIWKCDKETNTQTEESWVVEKGLRKHIDDVCDLCWSPDSNYLVTCSVDNTAIVWDVKKGVTLHIWSEHNGFVQGVNFDPLKEYVATMSSDRVLRLFNLENGKLSHKVLKYVIGGPSPCNRIFHDDQLKTFCRRLSWSPKGEFLIVPGGILPPDSDAVAAADSEKMPKTGNKEKESNDRNAVIVFCRNSLKHPCCIIPTGTSYSIVTRFCPIYFQKQRDVIPYDENFVNPVKKSERLVTCVGKLQEPVTDKKSLLDMPYRLVFAVGTNDSILILDTQSVVPLAVIRNIHLTRLTDLTWSPDGRILMASSTDGYCSIITFENEELGIKMSEPIIPTTEESFPIPATPITKIKIPAQNTSKKPSTPKQVTPKSEKRPATSPLTSEKPKQPRRIELFSTFNSNKTNPF